MKRRIDIHPKVVKWDSAPARHCTPLFKKYWVHKRGLFSGRIPYRIFRKRRRREEKRRCSKSAACLLWFCLPGHRRFRPVFQSGAALRRQRLVAVGVQELLVPTRAKKNDNRGYGGAVPLARLCLAPHDPTDPTMTKPRNAPPQRAAPEGPKGKLRLRR